MKTFVYLCGNGHQFEKFARKNGMAYKTAKCPVCGQRGRRQFSAASIQFLTGGFYKSDNKRPDPAKSGEHG